MGAAPVRRRRVLLLREQRHFAAGVEVEVSRAWPETALAAAATAPPKALTQAASCSVKSLVLSRAEGILSAAVMPSPVSSATRLL